MERLRGLENEGRKTGNVRMYSAFVKFMQLVLPLAAIAIIMVLMLWPRLSADKIAPLDESDLQALKRAESENRLLSPVFNTQDDAGRPLTITAEQAVQLRADRDRITLVEPAAALKAENGTMQISGETGEYDQSQNTMVLQGGVSVTDGENILKTETLSADIGKGRAESASPAMLTTKNGTVTGQKVIVEDNGQRTIFKGPAKAVIMPVEGSSGE